MGLKYRVCVAICQNFKNVMSTPFCVAAVSEKDEYDSQQETSVICTYDTDCQKRNYTSCLAYDSAVSELHEYSNDLYDDKYRGKNLPVTDPALQQYKERFTGNQHVSK